MKILKPGKVEQRKFVCPKCECVFTAAPDDAFWVDSTVHCPQGGCDCDIPWDSGEPYEEPTPTQTDSNAYEEALSEVKRQFMEELIVFCDANGVTFREG